ncbi:uncharacterized protein LOC114847276 isoform X2 [Betta splendens]|uniref:Uncharacterized protein LOC114847276 isoform X2 n=1 Tax=Betta splendens TaxID=158456 RepID=A0A9W2XHN5_BETSP|nr:uncharacterized protein LOC114847276 isoform X2 [Betta splendens]
MHLTEDFQTFLSSQQYKYSYCKVKLDYRTATARRGTSSRNLQATSSDNQGFSVMAFQNPCSKCGQHLQSHPVETAPEVVKNNDNGSSKDVKKQATRNSDTQESLVASQDSCLHCGHHLQPHPHQTAREVVKNNYMRFSSEDLNQAARNSDTQESLEPSQDSCSCCGHHLQPHPHQTAREAARKPNTQGSSVRASPGPCLHCGHQLQPHPDQTPKEEDAKGFSKKNTRTTTLSLFPSRPTVTVFSLVTGETFDAHKSLLKKVKNEMSSKTKMKNVPNQPDSDIIIVFCPIMSRVGSDVEAAMMHMKDLPSSDEKPVILVIMHHTRKDNYSTHGRKWSEIYPVIKSQVHVLFHETQPGLLKCNKNDQAVNEILKTLCLYSQR